MMITDQHDVQHEFRYSIPASATTHDVVIIFKVQNIIHGALSHPLLAIKIS